MDFLSDQYPLRLYRTSGPKPHHFQSFQDGSIPLLQAAFQQ